MRGGEGDIQAEAEGTVSEHMCSETCECGWDTVQTEWGREEF